MGFDLLVGGGRVLRSMKILKRLVVGVSVGLVVASLTRTAELGTPEAAGSSLVALLEAGCGGCHVGTSPAGGLDLRALSADLASAEVRERWIEIFDRVERREMPPPGSDLPEERRRVLLKRLGAAITAADRADIVASGRGPIRRLNRDEYEQNLRDLLKLPHLDIRDMLPEDRQSHHFNKVAATLDVSRVQLAAYLDAAEVALSLARSEGASPPPVAIQRAVGEQLSVGRETTGGREAMFWVRNDRAIDLVAEKKAAVDKSRVDPTISMALFRSPGWPYGSSRGGSSPGSRESTGSGLRPGPATSLPILR